MSGRTEEFVPFPDSEATLTAWENRLLPVPAVGATKGAKLKGRLVKLAFRELYFPTNPALLEAIAGNNFYEARRLSFKENATGALPAFIRKIRDFTDAGYEYVRFYGMSDGAPGSVSPDPRSTYWRRLSLSFAYLNGPLAGEKVFMISRQTMPLSDVLAEEMYVAISAQGTCLGAETVHYGDALDRIEGRRFYGPEHNIARQGMAIAKTLLESVTPATTPLIRLPLVCPPQSVLDTLGVSPSPFARPYDSAGSFEELLPPLWRL